MPTDQERYVFSQKLGMLGAGTFGEVYRGIDKELNVEVAIKKIRISTDRDGVASTELREMSILKGLKRHDNIVALMNVVFTVSHMLLIFELCDENLSEMLTRKPIRGVHLRHLMQQLLKGIAYCHARRVVHRDLKPQNILIVKGPSPDDVTLKIGDFGMARSFTMPFVEYTHEVMTPWYRAPEILLGETHYDAAVDLWSCGAIMSEMARAAPLFHGDVELEVLLKIFQVRGTPTPDTWKGVQLLPAYQPVFPQWRPKDLAAYLPEGGDDGIDLLTQLLQCDPRLRITAKQAVQHPYFSAGNGHAPPAAPEPIDAPVDVAADTDAGAVPAAEAA